MSFIVIEGLDGAGKSTQIANLANFFEGKGIEHKTLHFPRTDSPFFGELVARFLRGEFGKIDQVDPYIVAMLYAGDRHDAASQIDEWLKDGYAVLLDRYVYSNIAFQCAKLKDDVAKQKLRDWIFELEYNHFKIPKPDLSIFLDVPFKFTVEKLTKHRMGIDREYLKGSVDIHEESLDFQEKVRQVYLNQENYDSRFVVVPCTNNKGEMGDAVTISKRIINLINERLKI
ncbi:MAG TPA: dTMP kinase [Tenuifilaceae bacterium]|nr:dTMP kinase [Tenuifilaceae bacterium]HPE17963.1 dTMP kinase [Tenuifilaceae bacterium]HPJ44915.1 dTMP kinase [Tenuifilaceae bacterium]HPQ33119.1 dTMP kinase [Tenuifilaceae bacterium]HRX67051.1 dTMP kinase [Tenuifilaceae bacterium]